MRISDWSSDVCSSDLNIAGWLAADPHGGVSDQAERQFRLAQRRMVAFLAGCWIEQDPLHGDYAFVGLERHEKGRMLFAGVGRTNDAARSEARSEEHTSELQSLMRNSYAVFCLKKKKK